MKLSKETLDYIQKVVNTASLVKIDSIIIEPGCVRAIDEEHTVFIMHKEDVPDMEFGSIGLNRTNVFTSRFELGRNMSDFSVEAVVDSAGTPTAFARSLTMKAKGIKVDYRCANPTLMKAPRQLADTLAHQVQLDPEVVLMMQKGQTAMSTDEIKFIGTAQDQTSSIASVFFEMSDINADKMSYQFANTALRLDGSDDMPIGFCHTYALKTLLPLFKINPTGHFILTTQGIMKIVINGLDVYVVPRT